MLFAMEREVRQKDRAGEFIAQPFRAGITGASEYESCARRKWMMWRPALRVRSWRARRGRNGGAFA